MSEAGERQRAEAKEDTFASWAKPRLEERVSERRWRPTNGCHGIAEGATSAARRRAIEGGRQLGLSHKAEHAEADV
jgi:hypothetical protein